MAPRSLLRDDDEPIRRIDHHSSALEQEAGVLVTDDPELIRAWAERHSAEPATGEATESGPATIDVHDGGAGIRFNFPGAGRFRPIRWEEWIDSFTRHDLMFVYEADTPGQPPSPRYRLVPREHMQKQPMR